MSESIRQYFAQKRGVAGVVAFIAVFLSLFQLYTGLFGSFDALMQRTIHLGLALLLVFLTHPSGKAKEGKAKVNGVDILGLAATLLALGYVLVRYEWITVERIAGITPLSLLEVVLSLLTILLILEATRRIVGMGLVGRGDRLSGISLCRTLSSRDSALSPHQLPGAPRLSVHGAFRHIRDSARCLRD